MIGNDEKNRLTCFDIAKGIGIILMIVGHMPSVPSVLRMWIFSFHMPLFFIISGYFFRPKHPYEYIKKTFKQLIVPYILYSVIFIIFDIFIFRDMEILLYEVKRLFTGQGGTDVLWFFLCLFIVQNVFCLINYFIRREIATLLCCFAFSVLGQVISGTLIGNLYKLSPACYALALYGMGYYLSKRWIFMDEFSFGRLKNSILLMFANVILCFLNIRLGFDNLDMNNSHYGFLPITMMAALAGSISIVCLSECISKLRVGFIFSYIGYNTKFFFPLMTYLPTRALNIYEIFVKTDAGSLFKILSKAISGVVCVACVELQNRIKTIRLHR